jgi:hypothetical protein
MQKFKKKPVVVEACQFNGSPESATEIYEWATSANLDLDRLGSPVKTWVNISQFGEPDNLPVEIWVETLEGTMTASVGDWIIRGTAGEFYPCKPDIFAALYDAEKS